MSENEVPQIVKRGRGRPPRDGVSSALMDEGLLDPEIRNLKINKRVANDGNGAKNKIPLEVMIAYRRKGLSMLAISKILGCHKNTVQNRLKGVAGKVDNLSAIKEARADKLAIISNDILNSIGEHKLSKAPLNHKALAFGVLYDKERLERGQSTQNIAYADMLKQKKEIEEQLKALEAYAS